MVVRSRLEEVLARLGADAQLALAANVWFTLSSTVVGLRKVEAAKRALELGEQCGDPLTTTLGLSRLAFGLMQAGQPQETQPIIERALRLSTKGDLARSAVRVTVLNQAAVIAHQCGRFDEARQLFTEALAVATARGDEDDVTLIRVSMAEFEFHAGNPEGALQLVRAFETKTREPRFRILALQNGAAYRMVLGDILGARAAAHQALALARGVEALNVVVTIQHLATVSALSGDARRAARLRGYADAWYHNAGYEREFTERRTHEMLMAVLHDHLSNAEIEKLTAEGAAWSEDRAVEEALKV
jgi:tetratricopeptide (TPR) repeat protein